MNTIKTLITSIIIALAITLFNINTLNKYDIQSTYETITLYNVIVKTNTTYTVCRPDINIKFKLRHNKCRTYNNNINLHNVKAYRI